MPAARKILAAVAIIVVAAVGGFAVARAITTDGPDPKIDDPVVVRPAGDSNEQKSPKNDSRDSDKSGNAGNKNGDKVKGGGDRDDRKDDRNGSGRGNGSDDGDLTPVSPSPGTYDDDDDDDDGDDRGDDDDDDGGDDD